MEKVAMTYIIDDDKIFVYVLKKVMEKNIKFKEIKEFRNGEEVLELITNDTNLPTVILLDINMPIIDGWQFLDQVEKLNHKNKINIFIMSSSIDQREIEKSKMYSTVRDFISKPINNEKLEKILEYI